MARGRRPARPSRFGRLNDSLLVGVALALVFGMFLLAGIAIPGLIHYSGFGDLSLGQGWEVSALGGTATLPLWVWLTLLVAVVVLATFSLIPSESRRWRRDWLPSFRVVGSVVIVAVCLGFQWGLLRLTNVTYGPSNTPIEFGVQASDQFAMSVPKAPDLIDQWRGAELWLPPTVIADSRRFTVFTFGLTPKGDAHPQFSLWLTGAPEDIDAEAMSGCAPMTVTAVGPSTQITCTIDPAADAQTWVSDFLYADAYQPIVIYLKGSHVSTFLDGPASQLELAAVDLYPRDGADAYVRTNQQPVSDLDLAATGIEPSYTTAVAGGGPGAVLNGSKSGDDYMDLGVAFLQENDQDLTNVGSSTSTAVGRVLVFPGEQQDTWSWRADVRRTATSAAMLDGALRDLTLIILGGAVSILFFWRRRANQDPATPRE